MPASRMMSTTTAHRALCGQTLGSSTLSGRPVICVPNDLTDSSVGYAKADSVKTNVWTIGVRGEAAVQLCRNSKIIPYVGLTYVRLNTDDFYRVSSGTHVSSTHQNLWTVPVGLMFTGKTAAASGWNLQPLLDIAYVRSFGDKDVKQRRLGFYCRIRQYGCLGQKMFCARAQALKPRRARSVWAFKAEPPAAATI